MELMICQGRGAWLFRDLGDAEGPEGPALWGPQRTSGLQAGVPRVPRSRAFPPAPSLLPAVFPSWLRAARAPQDGRRLLPRALAAAEPGAAPSPLPCARSCLPGGPGRGESTLRPQLRAQIPSDRTATYQSCRGEASEPHLGLLKTIIPFAIVWKNPSLVISP